MTTLCNVCQYSGGCLVHRGVFSTMGGYHEYIGGRGDTMSTSREYHEYMGGGVFSTLGKA